MPENRLPPVQLVGPPSITVTLTKAAASSQQSTQAPPPTLSDMERGSSEPPVARSASASGPPASSGPVAIPRSASISCHPHPGSKKHKRTPLYQRSVRRRSCVCVRLCACLLETCCVTLANSLV